MNHDGRKPWTRQLLVGLGALLAVALVVGGVIGAFALGSSTVGGSGGGAGTESEASTSPSLTDPGGTPTGTATDDPSSEPPASEAPSPTQEPVGGAAITLRAAPASVRANERINLSGVYPRRGGATLQVQRFDGRWADFPVRVSVDGGRFSSFIQSSRTGTLRFRVVDEATGRVSNPVLVRIR